MGANDGFYQRLFEAEAAGLNKEWQLMVAYKWCTLEEALGDMDLDSEVAEMLAQQPEDDLPGQDSDPGNHIPF